MHFFICSSTLCSLIYDFENFVNQLNAFFPLCLYDFAVPFVSMLLIIDFWLFLEIIEIKCPLHYKKNAKKLKGTFENILYNFKNPRFFSIRLVKSVGTKTKRWGWHRSIHTEKYIMVHTKERRNRDSLEIPQ